MHYMKEIFKAVCIVIVFASCQNFEGHQKNDKTNEAKQAEKKNSYSFFSSRAEEY